MKGADAASRLFAVAALLACLAFAFLVVTPGALGGSATDPEIMDQVNDQRTDPGGQATCPGPGGVTNACFSNADIAYAWIDNDTAESISVHIKVQGTAAPATLGTAYEWNFRFKVGATDHVATLRLNGLPPAGGATGPLNGAVTVTGVASSGTAGGGFVHMVIPKANIGSPASGTPLTGLHADSESYVMGAGPNAIRDRAPDGTAFGRDYVIGGTAGNLTGTTVFKTVTGATFRENVGGNASSDTYQYNWTSGPSNGTVTYNATGNGSVRLVITDANGTEAYNQTVNGTGNFTIENATAGNWTVRYILENFTGTFTAEIEPGLGEGGNGSGGTGTSTGTGTGGTGTGTRTGTGTGSQGQGGGNGTEDTDDILGRLTADPAYLYTSAAGFGAVSILAIVGLAARWRL